MLEEFYQMPEILEDWRMLRSEGYFADAKVRGPDGECIPMASLPPLMRTLLVTDGTVTKVLEAFFWEPINVRALRLEVKNTEGKIPWLGVEAGEEVLTRHVHLVGEHSGNLYAEAFSVIKLGEFDTSVQEALIKGRVGIGVLLRESGLETYREILMVGMESDPKTKSAGNSGLWIHRTYRITREQKPVILIRESFPCHLYDQSDH